VSSDDDADEAGELRSVDDDAGDNDGTESTLSILEQWERMNVAAMTLGILEECLVARREERKARKQRLKRPQSSIPSPGNACCDEERSNVMMSIMA